MSKDIQTASGSPEKQHSDPKKAPGAMYFDLNHDRIIRIKSLTEKGFKGEVGYYDEEWRDYGECYFERKLVFIGFTREEVEEYKRRGKELLDTGEGIEMIKAVQEDQEEPTMALIKQEDKVFAMQRKALSILEKSEAIKEQMNVAMAVKRLEMELIMSEAKALISEALEAVDKIQKVVRSLELYAGINEELVQIKEGNPAPPETPLHLRQAVVFMDEEVGQWREGGFDYSNVTDFDNWLTIPANLFRVCPEEKCIVAFRPRRNDKDYGRSENLAQAMHDAKKAVWNKETYFLIRNGGNLYRIFTSNLQLGKKMFMSANDLEKLSEPSESDVSFSGYDYAKKQKEKEIPAIRDLFTRQALFLQGILDRGEVLNPVPPGINIFSPDTYQNWLRLIYDADGVLSDGRPTFKEWKDAINESISEGSRVILADDWLGSPYAYKDKNISIMNERTKRYYDGGWNMPSPPWNGGLFIAEKGFDRGKYNSFDFSIKYFPGGEYWSGWGRESIERKNRIAFGVNKKDNVFNYDAVSLEDVEFYMNDRANRAEYATMLPLLEKIRVERLLEIDQEKDFVRLISYQAGRLEGSPND